MKLSIPLIDGEYSKCTMYAVNYTQLLIDNIRDPDPTWETQSCVNGYVFDRSEITYSTIATEVIPSKWLGVKTFFLSKECNQQLGWVCENDILPTIAQVKRINQRQRIYLIDVRYSV